MMIPKYQNPSGPLNKYFTLKDDGYYYGTKSGKRYTASSAAQWLTQNGKGNYNANSFSRAYDQQNPRQLNSPNILTTIGKGVVGYVRDMFTYQGNGNAVMKLTGPGQAYLMAKNLHQAYNDQLQNQNQQQQQQTTPQVKPKGNSGFSTDKYDFETSPIHKNNASPATTTTTPSATAPVNEWETKYNELNTRYQELQKQIEELRKPITPQEVSPTPTQVETPQLTQNKVRLANTEAFLNNSRNPMWRRRYREGLNTALRSGDLYNVYTGQGNQSFDMAGLSMGDLLSTEKGLRYFDPVKGFTRGGIRRLAKDYRKGRIGTSMGQALSNFIGQPSNGSPVQTNVAPPEDWTHNYGVQQLGVNPIINAQPVDTGEPDVIFRNRNFMPTEPVYD